jgi:hypothetical protein
MFVCHECDHEFDHPDRVRVSPTWTEFRCPRCGDVFGGQSDEGALDAGIIADPAPFAHTALFGRFQVRSAADRSAALSEALREFFRREDGTNALDDGEAGQLPRPGRDSTGT